MPSSRWNPRRSVRCEVATSAQISPDPDGLVGWEQEPIGGRLDLGDAAEGVLELVQVVVVPAGDDLVADLEGVRTGSASPPPVTSRSPAVAATVTLLAAGAATAMAESVEARGVNKRHLETLSSPRWAQMLQQDLLPWVESIGPLGDNVLEIGPGPGLTTDILRERTARLTSVEVDGALAATLAERLGPGNVTVINGTAERLDLAADRFTAAACFAVMHHVPSAAQQDRIFGEILRVLQPGAMLVGCDGYDDPRTREAHEDHTFVPLDPDALPARLTGLGYADVRIDRGDYDFRYAARKPGSGA